VGGVGAWGRNGEGEQGIFPPYEGSVCPKTYGPQASALPTNVPIGASGSKLYGAGQQYMSLSPTGEVWEWGEDNEGSMGLGHEECGVRLPARLKITGVSEVKSAAFGGGISLWITSTGTLYGAGSDASDQLGYGGETGGERAYTPKLISGVSEVIEAAGGDETSYALESNGSVWAWGGNRYGQLGNGTSSTKYTKTPAAVPGLSNVIAIAANGSTAYALESSGKVFAWGGNAEGELGNGKTVQSDSAIEIPGLAGVKSFEQSGAAVTQLVVKTDGSVWGWGPNQHDLLLDEKTEPSLVPIQVKGLSEVTEIASSYNNAMVLKSNGTVWSWGTNEEGQLGNGTNNEASTPVEAFGVTNASQIAAGNRSEAVVSTVFHPVALTYPEEIGGSNPSGPCGCGQGSGGDPVDTATGEFSETYTDLSIPGRGIRLGLTRSYGSGAAATKGALGYGWNYNYGMSLQPGEPDVVVKQENGSQVSFTKTGSTYTAPSWAQATLVHNESGVWTFTRRDKTIFTFSSEGRLTSEKNLNGYVTAFTYPSSSEMVVTDPAGRTLKLAFNTEGLLTSVTDGFGRTVSYKYESAGNLSEVINVGGGHTQYTYDSEHHLLTIREPKYYGEEKSTKPVLTTEYAEGRVTSQTDQVGRTTKFEYKTSETTGVAFLTTIITDPAGHETAHLYRDGVEQASVAGYGTIEAAATSFTYDSATGLVDGVCTALGHCTTRTYDEHGNKLKETDPLGRTTEYTYDALNDVKTVKDPLGVTTTMTYDGSGNILTKSRPLLNSKKEVIATQKTEYKYGGTEPVYPGDITSIVEPNGNTWKYRYDAYGDLISTTAPPTAENSKGDQTSYGYNTATGWRTSRVAPKGNLTGETAKYTTTYGYDNFGHVISIHDPLWTEAKAPLHQKTFHYDANQNLEYTIDGNGKKTVNTYDPADELIETEKPNGSKIRQDYWPNGLLKDRYDPNNNDTSYEYDVRGDLTSETNAEKQTTTYRYDADGHLIEREAPGANCAESGCSVYLHDAAGELTEISHPDGKTPNLTKITYDADGHRTGMTDASGTSTWSWDSLGRLTSSKDGYGNELTYGYDLDGNLTTITYPGKLTVTRKFDAADRMESLEDWSGNKTTFTYDADSNLVGETLPSGAKVTSTLSYDATDHNTAITVAKEKTTLAGFTYTRDGVDQLASAVTTGLTEASQSYSYTPNEQLETSGPAAEPTKYAYEPAGNITKRSKTAFLAYNSADEPCWQASSEVSKPECEATPTGATKYTYENSGNRISTTPSGGKAVSYVYNDDNELTSYNGAASYVYDGDGVRLAKTVGKTTEHFVWDHADSTPLLLEDGTNYYIYGPTGLPLEQISKSGTITYLFHDQLGSTRLLVNTKGEKVGGYNYDPYGIATHTGTVTTPLQYAGQYADSESGLIYMRARYYDPTSGQFLTVDPLVTVTQTPYGYVSDNPLNAGDPTGLEGACETAAEYLERLERLEKLRERVARENAEEQREIEEQEKPWENLLGKTIKVLGGCDAGSTVGIVGGVAVGAGVGGPAGAVVGATVGGPIGCIAGAIGTVYAPVNPLQPSEGGP
jgi:RHS repeat-associated protein